jgi:hypothetical protein
MEQLRQHLETLINTLEDANEITTRLASLISVYPFNEFEFMISALLGRQKLTLDEYYELRDEYVGRNLYLYVFEIGAPRGFGEAWAQGHLKALVPELTKPSKKLDPNYLGEYDFFLDGIRIEVKASRAVDFERDEPLYVKALSSDSDRPFDMNFQQVMCSFGWQCGVTLFGTGCFRQRTLKRISIFPRVSIVAMLVRVNYM